MIAQAQIAAIIQDALDLGNPDADAIATQIAAYLPAPAEGSPADRFDRSFTEWVASMTDPPLIVGDTLVRQRRTQEAVKLCTVILFGNTTERPQQPRERVHDIHLVTFAAKEEDAQVEAARIFDAIQGRIEWDIAGGWRLHSVVGSRPRWTGTDPRGSFQFTSDLTVRTRQTGETTS